MAARPSRSNDGRRRCDCCRVLGHNRFYCNHCKLIFCDAGWNRQITHTQMVDAVHEKTPIVLFEMLRDCLRPNRTQEQQKRLHHEDEETTWFGVIEDEAEEKIFQDYGRFGELMKLLSGNRTHDIFPAIVSFVGNTGTGKSTLIKILIELYARAGFAVQTPVVGSLEACNRPASVDVHIYSDPKSEGEKHPIVYADSEGLEAGEIEPTAIRDYVVGDANGPGSQSRRPRQYRKTRKAHYGSERPINWATTVEKRSRRFTVTNVYPRVLYTFSDVVVFVIKNGKEFENAAIHLLSWAEKAIEKSVNQPVLPHAIIAVNEAALNLSYRHWSVEDATRRLFRDYQFIIHGNPNLDSYIQDCRSRGEQVVTLEGLLLMYYSSIRVIKIPEGGQPNLMEQQMRKLYVEIDRACKKSHETKKVLRMLFTATELNSYLQCALDHFAKTLDEPFDFIQTLSISRPIPQDLGGNILNLALKSVKRTKSEDHEVSAPEIFRELSYMIGSCIMLDTARRGKRGPSQKIFSEYVTHCDDALEKFCDRGWPCSFKRGVYRCVNVRVGHPSTGHQRRDGTRMGAGDYEPSFSASELRRNFRDQIYVVFQQSMDELNRISYDRASESPVATNIHKRVLRRFFQHIGGAKAFKSNFSCFACLVGSPEHPLYCGHVLCTPCVKSYGYESTKNFFEVKFCPLEVDASFKTTQIILKPRTSGVRILALDGGGVRAIAELEILRALESELGGKIPARAFFDLIVGTDMGGLLALDLAAESGRLTNWSADFKLFCLRVFDRPRLYSIVSQFFYPLLYKTTPLETQLKQRFGTNPFFGWWPQATPRAKVAVISSSATGMPCIIANYNRSCAYRVPYIFDRPELPKHDLRIWEVARAIVAVPTIFKSFTNHQTHRTYHGGPVKHINPVAIADRERKAIWPDLSDSAPDFIVSIGTGRGKRKRFDPLTLSRWSLQTSNTQRSALVPEYCTQFAEMLWNDFRDSAIHNTLDELRYVRLNIDVDEPLLEFDSATRMRSLQDHVRAQNRSIDYKSLAQQLIASCFYFEVTEQTDQPSVLPDATFKFSGSLYCRLAETDLRHLGDYFRKNFKISYPHFIATERGSTCRPNKVWMDGEVISRMLQRRQFNISLPEISVSQITAIVEIMMEFENGQSFPISGFPRPLYEDDMEVPPPRPQSNQDSNSPRRDGSEDSKPEEWKGPTASASDSLNYSLSEYCNADYVLGTQAILNPNAIELEMPSDHQRRGRNREREDRTLRPNPSSRFELPNRSSRSSNMPELPTSGSRTATIVELPGDSLRSRNMSELPDRGSRSRHIERQDHTMSPRSTNVAELPAGSPPRRRPNRSSDPTSKRSRSTRSATLFTTDPSSRSSRRPSSSRRRHSDRPTLPLVVTGKDSSLQSEQRNEAASSVFLDGDSRRRGRPLKDDRK